MILVTQKGVLTAPQKTKLSKDGYTVIECNDPDKVRILAPESTIDANALLLAALKGLYANTPVGKTEIFVNSLYDRLNKS